MSKATEPYSSVWHYLRDSAIGFVLLIGGFALASIIAEALGPQQTVVYVFGACICMIPFLWFAQRCGVMKIDRVDFVVGVCFITGIFFVGEAIDVEPLWLVPIFVCLKPIWDRFRGRKSEA